MRISALLATGTLVLSLTACGTPQIHNTMSGKVEETFTQPPDQVKPQLIALMVQNRFNLTKDTPYMMSFDKPVDNIMASVLLGSRYDATPNARLAFTFIAVNNTGTRLIADFSIVTNPGSAFEQITPMNAGDDSAKIQIMLDSLSEGMAKGLHMVNDPSRIAPIVLPK